MPEHRDSTELLIIGGGVIGASIAFHCAAAGVRVTLLEKNDESPSVK